MTAPAPLPAERRYRPPARKGVGVFLEHLAAGWTVTAAAAEAGCDRRRFYEYRKRNPEFSARWDDAEAEGADRLIDEARSRALGYDESTYDGDGNLMRRVRRYSDPLLIAMLKARDPARFRDGTNVNVETRVEVEVGDVREKLAARLAGVAARLREPLEVVPVESPPQQPSWSTACGSGREALGEQALGLPRLGIPSHVPLRREVSGQERDGKAERNDHPRPRGGERTPGDFNASEVRTRTGSGVSAAAAATSGS